MARRKKPPEYHLTIAREDDAYKTRVPVFVSDEGILVLLWHPIVTQCREDLWQKVRHVLDAKTLDKSDATDAIIKIIESEWPGILTDYRLRVKYAT